MGGTVNVAVNFMDNGVEITAVLGGNPQSPGCAVHLSDAGGNGVLIENSGIFMKAFQWEKVAIEVEKVFNKIIKY